MNLYDIVTPMTVEEAKATSQRLDAKCWKGKHKEGTKIKGGVRVNNCIPNESIEEAGTRAGALNTAQQLYKAIQSSKGKPQHEIDLLQRQLNALARKYQLKPEEYTAGANQQSQQQAGGQQQRQQPPPPPPGGQQAGQQNANQQQSNWWQQQYEKHYGQNAQQQQQANPDSIWNPAWAAKQQAAYRQNGGQGIDPNWAQNHMNASAKMMQANQADMNKMMQAQMASGPWNMPGAKMAAEEVAEAQTDYQKRRQRERDIDAGKPVPKQRQSSMTDYQKRRAEQKRQEQLGENAWNDGTNDWTSEHDQWTKESTEPVTELKIDPRKAKPGQTQDEKYKGWNLRYQMRPAAGSKEYLGRADHLQSKQTKPIGPLRANSAEELVQQLKNAIDTGRGSNPITTGRVTIFFNSNLAKEVIGHGGNIYADIEKHGNTPLLLLSAEDQGGMQLAVDRSSTVQKSKEGHVGSQAFQFPAEKAKAMGLTLARYAVGSPVDYAPGITAIPLEFRSEVYPGETIKIGEPGVTVSPPKMGQTMESSNDPVAIDSTSPVGGNVQEGRLQVGDPVIVTAPNAYEGKTGEIAEFSPSGKFVIVDLYNHGRHSMHLSDVEYNQYADDQDADEYSDDKIDEDTGPSPVASAITRRILQQRLDLLKQYGPELVGSAVDEVADYVGDVEEIGSSDVSAWVNQVERMLKENPPEAFAEEAHMYRGPHGHADVDRKGGVTRVTRRDWDDTSKATTDVKGGKYFPNKDIKGQGTGSVASNGTSSLNSIPGGSYRKTPRLDHDANDAPNYDVDEGFQDFNKVEPYAVCLAGKPVKQFDYYEDARRFHDNWKKKLYREGNTEKADKITLMPLNLDEEEQKPYNPNEFRPVGPITIVPPKKLKSGETHQGINDYWKAHGQAPIYKTNEMDKSQTPPGRAGDYPLGVKGTTGKPVTAKKVVKDLTKDLNQAFSKEKKVKEAGNPAQQAAIAIAKKKEQGVAEGSLDEVSRRGFLKGLGAAAVAGAAGGVKANNSHLDYEWDQLTSPVDKTIYEMLNLYFLCKNEPKMIGDDCDKVKSLISKFVADPKNKQIVNKLYGSVVRDNTKMGKKFNQPYDTVTLWHEYGKRRNEIMKNFSALSPEFESVQQGVAEGYADQQRKIFKKNGEPVGEVGIDRESSPGNGQWYMKCYAYNIDNAGYDSYEEAVAELKHCMKQGMAEDTGSWIVYDPETKQIKKRFKTHTAGKSYAKTHGLGFASSEYYFDRVKGQEAVAESTNYWTKLQDERNTKLNTLVNELKEITK